MIQKSCSKSTKDLISESEGIGTRSEEMGRQLSDLEILAELQHFGAATCLIDFSRSALVALWFACQTGFKRGRKRKSIYAVRHDDMVRLENS